MTTTAHIFRRHQCKELGWEWYCARSLEGPVEELQSTVDEFLNKKLKYQMIPGNMTLGNFKVRYATGGFDETEDFRIEELRKLNVKFMEERAKWPNLVEDCSLPEPAVTPAHAPALPTADPSEPLPAPTKKESVASPVDGKGGE